MVSILLTPRGFSIDGRPVLIQAGRLHYFRLPHPDLWRPALERLRMAGYNTVVLPIPWAYHSPAPGLYDFTGLRDLPRLLSEAVRAGLWVIVQGGPRVGVGLDRGGVPAWLPGSGGERGFDSPVQVGHLYEWWERLWPIVQACETLLAVQVTAGDEGVPEAWVDQLRQQGLTVPILTAGACYPILPSGPEDGWGGIGPERLRRQLDPRHPLPLTAQALAAGAAGYVLDPFVGGITWGYWGAPEVYTAYGSGAPVDASGALDEIYFRARQWAMTVETVGAVLAAAEATETLYASGPEVLAAAWTDGTTTLALLHAGRAPVEGVRLSLPVGDQVWTSPPIRMGAGGWRLLPMNWPLAGGVLRATTLEPVLRVTVAGRELLIVVNDGGGDLLLSDDFRVRHAQGAVRALRGEGGLAVRIEPDRLASLLLDGPRGVLQILALEPAWAARVWPLDDAWRTTPVPAPAWAPDPQEPARGLLFGHDWVMPRPDGSYAFLAESKGFSYRWGPWRGSNPQTWLSPMAWEAPPLLRLPELIGWESRAAAPEALPEYDDRDWREIPPQTATAMEAQGVPGGFAWYRGHFAGPASAVTLTCRHSGDLYLNGELIAVLNVLPGTPEAIAPVPQTIPLAPARLREENVLAILTECLGHPQNLEPATEFNGLLACRLEEEIPIRWYVRGGLSGERGQQGFPGFADWGRVPAEGADAVLWHRVRWPLAVPEGIEAAFFLIVERLGGKALLYLNGQLIGRYWEAHGPQRRFWLPEGVLRRRGENELWVAQWPRGAEPGPGRLRLETGRVGRWQVG